MEKNSGKWEVIRHNTEDGLGSEPVQAYGLSFSAAVAMARMLAEADYESLRLTFTARKMSQAELLSAHTFGNEFKSWMAGCNSRFVVYYRAQRS